MAKIILTDCMVYKVTIMDGETEDKFNLLIVVPCTDKDIDFVAKAAMEYCIASNTKETSFLVDNIKWLLGKPIVIAEEEE